MSLLIKALDKAEKDQAKNIKTAKDDDDESSLEWSLETINKEPVSENSKSNTSKSELEKNPLSSELKTKELANHGLIATTKILDNSVDAEVDEISLIEVSTNSPLIGNQGHQTNAQSSISQSRSRQTQQMQSAQNQAKLNQQGQAANVFSAKRSESSIDSKKIALVGFVGLFVLLLIGAGLYSYYFNKPVLPAKPSFIQAPLLTPHVVTPSSLPNEANQIQVNNNTPAISPSVNSVATESVEKKQSPLVSQSKAAKKDFVSSVSPTKLETINSRAIHIPSKNSEHIISSPSTKVTITKNKPEASVNPTLLNAYQAYTVGEDVKAQQLYKQVLQSENRNIDAILGLAAIAQRQNRKDDAVGWYKKVLELDPKNAIAQSSLIDTQLDNSSQADPVASESRLKNLLAQQPENASLQAALGGLYSDQNQWPSAQQAYFEAHRIAPSNADYTFNLAVSLDQMGKPMLALPYYKRTLELLPKSANTGISEAVVKARIKAIE